MLYNRLNAILVFNAAQQNCMNLAPKNPHVDDLIVCRSEGSRDLLKVWQGHISILNL